jgi:hypothetical protein
MRYVMLRYLSMTNSVVKLCVLCEKLCAFAFKKEILKQVQHDKAKLNTETEN